MTNQFSFLIVFFSLFNFLFRSAPHRIEELFALVPLVVPLNARLTVEFDFASVASEAPERLLLHTALGKHVLGADTPRHSVSNPWVLLSFESEEELLDLSVILVLFAAPPDSTQNIGGAVL